MQSTAITSKGQVTIPVAIRKQFGLSPGERVRFSVEDEKIILHPVPVKIEDSFGLVSSTHSVSLAEMDAIIQNQAGK